MTFDQWIDAVNVQVHARLGDRVRTEELSWDSALWASPTSTVVAALDADETTAKLYFDGGDHLAFAFRDEASTPDAVGATIAKHLVG
ncbi:MAG: hypothetical protein NVS3B17_21560 [Vulcanimicrobiaceae bacterium]